jgi:aminoglycoside phosphotransferase (APT) family kinase protein
MTFADNKIALQIIKDLYPGAQKVKLVEHGYDNLVVLVDEKYAVRFPKHDGAYAHSKYEKEILSDLVNFDKVKVPKILGEGEYPPYMITTFLHGTHLKSAEIRELPFDKQEKIGEQFAIFAHAMHSLHSVERARQVRQELKLDEFAEEPWDIYFARTLFETKLQDDAQDKIVKEYFKKWSELKYSTPEFVLHDDLHNDNLLFIKGELTGVLDFGDTNIGHPEQELRQLYRINEITLDAAVKKYEGLSGLNLNVEAIKVWCILQEMAVYSSSFIKNDFERPGFARGVKNLNRWFPEANWGAGIKNSE